MAIPVKVREFAVLFAVQTVLYGIHCINTRAVAELDYSTAVGSDFLIATMTFFVIRKIAREGDEWHQWSGYVSGSIAGTVLGIWLSARLTP
jgi:hypothetical protein